MSGDQLQFIDYRKPKLEAGDYECSTSHRYKGKGSSDSASLNIRVSGERVHIDDSQIFGRYPPPSESGNFADTIPHISFNKGTLPWIRSAYSKDDETIGNQVEIYEPWLYLLVVNENDFAEGRVRDFKPCALHQLNSNAYFPEEQFNSLNADATLIGAQKTVSSVVLKKSLFKDLLLNGKTHHNDKDQLEYLAHIRRRWQELGEPIRLTASAKATLNDASKSYVSIRSAFPTLNLPETAKDLIMVSKDRSWLNQDSMNGDLLLDVVSDDGTNIQIQKMSLNRELSVLMANRFAQNAAATTITGRNIAMVVSLEKYLTIDSLNAIDGMADNANMRFVVLTSWEFECQPVSINFEQRSKALDANSLKYEDREINQMLAFSSKLEAGMVPLPHALRNNDRGLSWYRGPLVPTVPDDWASFHLTAEELGEQDQAFVATDADKLLRYHPKDGMFDISYAAAYELGRVLSLQQAKFLKTLRQYKRSRSRYIKLVETDAYRMEHVQDVGIHIDELPYAQLQESVLAGQKTTIEHWLMQLAHLSPIPSWYLVPDYRLLPPRSIRTFNIDPVWLQALWLGALSLDGRPQVTNVLFKECWNKLQSGIPRAGAFLRSDIIWAYPELVVNFRNIDQQAVDISDDLTVNLKDVALNHFTSVKANIDLAEVKDDFEDNFTDLIEMHPPITITDAHKIDEDLTLYLTEKPFDYVSLALPLESLHYGADFKNTTNTFRKDIKFRGNTVESITVPMVDLSLAIIDVPALALAIKSGLKTYLQEDIAAETDADQKQQLQSYYDNLAQFKSARIGRFMLEGEPKVEFTVGLEGE